LVDERLQKQLRVQEFEVDDDVVLLPVDDGGLDLVPVASGKLAERDGGVDGLILVRVGNGIGTVVEHYQVVCREVEPPGRVGIPAF